MWCQEATWGGSCPPDRRPGPKNGHRVTLVTIKTFCPPWGCPGFCVERRPPQAGDVERKNLVQPQSGDLDFRF